jgi:hypothetical protein
VIGGTKQSVQTHCAAISLTRENNSFAETFCGVWFAELRPESAKHKVSLSARLVPNSKCLTVVYQGFSCRNVMQPIQKCEKWWPPQILAVLFLVVNVPPHVFRNGYGAGSADVRHAI